MDPETESQQPPVQLLTLVYVTDHGRVLLGMKKRGFGEGRWNGFGGKVHKDETIEDAAKRELEEEAMIKADALVKCGVLTFKFVGNPVPMEVHAFTTDSYTGEPTETEEMRPCWYKISEVPYDGMWPDDYMWLPRVLERGEFIRANFHFDGMSTILDSKVEAIAPP